MSANGFPDRANYIHSAHRQAKNILLADRDFHALLRTHETKILALNWITTSQEWFRLGEQVKALKLTLDQRL